MEGKLEEFTTELDEIMSHNHSDIEQEIGDVLYAILDDESEE